MMYLWLVPLIVIAVVLIVILYKTVTRQKALPPREEDRANIVRPEGEESDDERP